MHQLKTVTEVDIKMQNILDKKLIFVTGKGGVGKTTVATGLAWLAQSLGKKTLICEVEPKGDVANSFECGSTPFSKREVTKQLEAMSMDTEASLREYLKLHLKLPVVGRIGPVAKAFEFVATAAPGVREILTVGKLCWEVKENHYDIVIVDASPTGHIVGQLAAPEAINELVKVGPIRSQTGWMLDILANPSKTGVVIVSTAEEMPVNETLDLSQRIYSETKVKLVGIVVNQVLPELFSHQEEELFEKLRIDPYFDKLKGVLKGDPTPIFDAARLAVTLRRSRASHLERLRSEINKNVPLLYLPYRFNRSEGLKSVRTTATYLSDELGF